MSKLGGYGGGSRVRREKLTCKQAKKLFQSDVRVRAAWKKLKRKTTIDGQPVALQISEWVRNLVEAGDIEPNPGPSRSLQCLAVNVGSFKG